METWNRSIHGVKSDRRPEIDSMAKSGHEKGRSYDENNGRKGGRE